MNTRINLAKEFENILKRFGRDVLVIRQDRKLRCETCFNEVTQEASRECATCFGLGWSYVAERHTIRSEDVSVPETLARLLGGKSIGQVSASSRRYFCLPNMRAQQDDLIIDVEWDEFGRPLYKNGGIWAINSLDSSQNLGEGQGVYNIAYVSQQPVMSKIRGIHITEINGVKQYQIAMEE